MTWDERFEQYKALWRRKRPAAVEKELVSMRRMLARNADTFFHESASDELSDGDRVMALCDIVDENKTKAP